MRGAEAIFREHAVNSVRETYLADIMMIKMVELRRIVLLSALLLVLTHVSFGQKIATGLSCSFWICDDSTAMASGQNASSQLTSVGITRAEVPIFVARDSIIAIDGGGGHTLALLADSRVWAWGQNLYGQLGLDDTTDRNVPFRIDSLPPIVAIAAGENHSLALAADGTVWCWGNNSDRQSADTSLTKILLPRQAIGPTGIVAIAAGINFSLALGGDGRIWAWGSNVDGRLGTGATLGPHGIPDTLSLDSVVAIAAGQAHGLALRSNGLVFAWGHNNVGQLGLGNQISQLVPDTVPIASAASAIAAGGSHSLLLLQNGSVMATGDNSYGQLGIDSTVNSITSFVTIGGGFTATRIACGENHCLAIETSGRAVSWGANDLGQLGNGTQLQQLKPMPVLGLCPTAFSVTDPIANSYFRPTTNTSTPNWIAGELSSSIRLKNGRVIWLCGHSTLDLLVGGVEIPCTLSNEVNNCVLMEDSLNPANPITLLDITPGNPNRDFFQRPGPDTGYFVPRHGYLQPGDSVVEVFLSHYDSNDVHVGTYSARIGIVTMTVLDISKANQLGARLNFGTAVIEDTLAGLLYVYGSDTGTSTGADVFPYLSRRSLSDTLWEFATNTGWSSVIADALPISAFPVSRQYSVIPLQGNYYLFTQTQDEFACGLQRNILAYKSAQPQGPFVPISVLATSEDSIFGNPGVAFGVAVHPDRQALGFSRCDSLLLSYNMRDEDIWGESCSKQCDFPATRRHADSWRPQFLRVPYALLDADLDTRTVANFTTLVNGMSWSFINLSQFATTFNWDFVEDTSTLANPPAHIFSSSGSYNVTLTVSGCGSTADTTFTIVQRDGATVLLPRIRVFPQPSRGPIHIQGEDMPPGPIQLQLCTLLGEVIAQQTCATRDRRLDTLLQTDAPAGMYLLRIMSPHSATYVRIVR